MNQATEQPKTEQPQKGWVTTSYRNYKGKRLGPYHYRRWKVGSKIHRQYIKPADVERVKAECAVYSEQRRSKRQGGRRVNVYLDNFIFQSKMYFRYEQGKEVRPDQEAYIARLHNEGMYITGRPLYRPRRVFGDPKLSNFIYECIVRNIDPLEAQLLSALGASIDQIQRILKSDPNSQARNDEMSGLIATFHQKVVTQSFGDPTFSNAASNSASALSPSDLNTQRSTLNAPSGFGDPTFTNCINGRAQRSPGPLHGAGGQEGISTPFAFGDPTLSSHYPLAEPSNPATKNRATHHFGNPTITNCVNGRAQRSPGALHGAGGQRENEGPNVF